MYVGVINSKIPGHFTMENTQESSCHLAMTAPDLGLMRRQGPESAVGVLPWLGRLRKLNRLSS